jgi:hypothetical protein
MPAWCGAPLELTEGTNSGAQRACSIRPRCIGVTRTAQPIYLSLCSGVKECGKKCAHNFFFSKPSFRIRRTRVLGMFKDYAIILYVIQQSFLTKSATAAMFTSVQVDFGWPSLPSLAMCSLPSQN